ncbi:glycosyltransferase family 4 protein [Candidatus Woesearchaeota archaeon]|nr:glycosyltransferase family 4 protein [Candidatus Woesearchaeota archaeon]
MKILFVLENYYPHIGGVETVFRNLAEGLAKKHEVTVITHLLKGAKKNEVLNGVRIKRISCMQSRYLFSFLAIPSALREAKKADIIHTTTFNGALPAWIASKIAGKKCAITVHEAWIGKWKEYTDMNFMQAAAHEFLEKLIYLLPFDKYVGVSNSTKQQLLGIGKRAEKTAAVYNSVDYNHFNPKKNNGGSVRKKYGLQKKFVCLTYGRPGPSKGIEYAVKAIPKISIPSLKFVFILSRDRQYFSKLRKLKALVSRLSIADKALFLEPVPYNELPQHIKAADCVVVPSLSEGFGYTAAEACALGVPVIATNTTSLPEVVSGKHLLVAPKNSQEIAAAVEKIYRKKYDKSPLKKFLPKENIDGYMKIYEELLRWK